MALRPYSSFLIYTVDVMNMRDAVFKFGDSVGMKLIFIVRQKIKMRLKYVLICKQIRNNKQCFVCCQFITIISLNVKLPVDLTFCL